MKKKFLMCGIALLAVALILGGMFWMKDHYYRRAQQSEALGRYELAAQEYEQAGRYKDAEAKMAEMNELAEITRTEVLKLFPIPNMLEEDSCAITYYCQESQIAILLNWMNGEGLDNFVQWGVDGQYSERSEKRVEFYGGEDNLETDIQKIRLVLYDDNTGEYLFSIFSGQYPLEESTSGEFIHCGILNEDGNLTIYTQKGETMVFEPFLYENSTTGERNFLTDRKIVRNP